MNENTILKQIADELGTVSIYEEYVRNIAALDIPKVRLGILGQSNVGKTSFINNLLNTSIVVSNFSSGVSHYVTFASKEETNETIEGFEMVYSDSTWLEKQSADVIEINKDIVLNELSPVDLCKVLSRCDACFYLLNAQAPLNRADMFVIKNLSEVKIPTKVLLTRGDFLQKEEFDEIVNYVRGKIGGYAGIEVVPSQWSLLDKSHSNELQDLASSLLTRINLEKSRGNFKNFYLGYALSRLFGNCQEKINACLEKQEKVKKQAEKKLTELNEKSTEWLKVETGLRHRTSGLSDNLHAYLENRKSEIIRRLNHDIDLCGDIKLFWEKDFPFRLEEIMKMETQSAAQVINRELLMIMQWLQDELMKKFKCKISVTSNVSGTDVDNTISSNAEVKVADTNRARQVIRIGTMATVFVAGSMFATAGIGGVAMAISMMSGIGADYWMNKKKNESRENVKNLIPEIVTKAQLKLVTDFSERILDVVNEIVTNIHSLKEDWESSSIKSIEQEKSIALYNLTPAKWENIMGRINQLSEFILK